MLKYKVIRSFIAVWCVVCLTYAGVRTTLGAFLYMSGTESEVTEKVEESASAEDATKVVERVPQTETKAVERTEVQEAQPEPETEAVVTTESEEAEAASKALAEPESESESESAPETETYTEPESAEVATTTDEDWTQETEEVVTEGSEETYAPSLYEYLSQFTCGSCRRNCSLSNPRCHNGSMLAQVKAQEYYSIYGQ